MANRSFIDKNYTLIKGEVTIYASVLVPTPNTGAPVLQRWNYPSLGTGANAWTYTAAPTAGGGSSFPVAYVTGEAGVRSVARTGAGAWTITLQDNYQRLLTIDPTFINPTGAPAAPFFGILSNAKGGATGDVTLQSGGTIQVLFQATVGGGGADPTAGELVRLAIRLQNFSEP